MRLLTTSIIAALVIVSFAACSKKSRVKPSETDTAASAEETFTPDSDSGMANGMQTVRFDFDSATLTRAAKAALKKNAAVLKADKKLKVRIEGHCDTRGTDDYNKDLGYRRAAAARKHLASLGIKANRMEIISFGEERPIDPDTSESAHAKNRRANFVILQ